MNILAWLIGIVGGLYFSAYFVSFAWLKRRGWKAVADLDRSTLALSNHRWIMPDGSELQDRGVWGPVLMELIRARE